MSDELKKKSVKELLDISVGIIKDYRILFDKILGQTPDEVQEMHKILEGLTSREIREALILYRGGQSPVRAKDMYTEELKRLLKGFEPWEVVKALNTYRSQNPIRGRLL